MVLVPGERGNLPPELLEHHLRQERSHYADHRQQDGEQGVQHGFTVHRVPIPLKPPVVHPDVPVGKVVDELDEAGDDGVEVVGRHLLGHELQCGLYKGDDPAIHHTDKADVAALHPRLTSAPPPARCSAAGSSRRRTGPGGPRRYQSPQSRTRHTQP